MRGARRWLPVLIAVLTWAAVSGAHAAAPPRTPDRTAHAIAHAAVLPVQLLGAVADVSAPAAVTGPGLLLLLVVGLTALAVPRSRRTTRVPARAPPQRRAGPGS